MEPPAKRLRILGSIDVDETNPDYIAAKQKQQQRFKNSLESLFSKFGDMHESQSDEIDMRDGKVVVDRGHLRRLNRQAQREETTLLDSIAMGAKGVPEGDLDEEDTAEEEDSEDELAPTQPTKSESARKGSDQQRTTAAGGTAAWSPNSGQLQLRQAMPVSSALAQPPMTPNPAANLLQFVQFPQTPAGQQAQMSFCATLTQTINQAVQQAVAPLFSSLLPNTPAAQLPFPSALPASTTTTPVTTVDKIAPATDPKWYFPPLPELPRKPEAARSSPNAASAKSSTQSIGGAEHEPPADTPTRNDVEENPVSIAGTKRRRDAQAHAQSKKTIHRSLPRVEIQNKSWGRVAKYDFTQEDDIRLAKLKEVHNLSWADIRNSQPKWANWPLWSFQQRYYKRLKNKSSHLKEATPVQVIQTSPRNLRHGTVSFPPLQLPTPSVSEQEDSRASVLDASTRTVENIMSSSTHYDDDERDLLSLAGEEIEDLQSVFDDVEEETFFPDADETILPSVEVTRFIDEDALQQGLLEGSPTEDATMTPVKIKQEPPYSSPSKRPKRNKVPIVYQAMPDSDTEASRGDTASVPPRPQEQCSFLCDICKATFQNVDKLDQHRTNLHTSRKQVRPRSASLDLVGDDDELQTSAPTTAHIKREFSTPPPTSFLLSTPLGQSRPHADLPSSGVKSASGLSRRAYLKHVKQSWAKKPTPAPKTVTKRKSFHTIPRKRAWAGDAESEDELGL